MKSSLIYFAVVAIAFLHNCSSESRSNLNQRSLQQMERQQVSNGWDTRGLKQFGQGQRTNLPVTRTLYFLSAGILFISTLVDAFSLPLIIPIFLFFPLALATVAALFVPQDMQSSGSPGIG